MKKIVFVIKNKGKGNTADAQEVFVVSDNTQDNGGGGMSPADVAAAIATAKTEANDYTDDAVEALQNTVDSQLENYQSRSEKGIANGYASLDATGKVPLSQISDTLLGNVVYQGVWNAATNTPNLTTVQAKGRYYLADVAGTFGGVDYEVGDWIISNGTTWNKVDNTDAVILVAGLKGNITAAALRIALNVADGATANQSDAVTNAAIDAKISKTTSPSAISAMWSGTQAQYDAIVTKDAATLYFIQ